MNENLSSGYKSCKFHINSPSSERLMAHSHPVGSWPLHQYMTFVSCPTNQYHACCVCTQSLFLLESSSNFFFVFKGIKIYWFWHVFDVQGVAPKKPEVCNIFFIHIVLHVYTFILFKVFYIWSKAPSVQMRFSLFEATLGLLPNATF